MWVFIGIYNSSKKISLAHRKILINIDKYNRKSLTFTRIEAGLIRLRKYIK